MKLSWTNFKISIAGARLIHLVQKDRIWDHGSMTEQARAAIVMLQKANQQHGIDSLKKHCLAGCFEGVRSALEKDRLFEAPLTVKEMAVLEVHPGNGKRPDMFTAIATCISENGKALREARFSARVTFARQGQWWMLTGVRTWTNHKAAHV